MPRVGGEVCPCGMILGVPRRNLSLEIRQQFAGAGLGVATRNLDAGSNHLAQFFALGFRHTGGGGFRVFGCKKFGIHQFRLQNLETDSAPRFE